MLKVEWGKPTTPELIDAKLASGKYAAITLIYNETSTGLMNPIYDIAKMMKAKYPDVLVFVDAVSGMIGQPIHFDELGWDVGFASVQKAFGLPPGFTVAAVSKRAVEKAKSVPDKGYYFNFIEWAKAAEKNQTLVTPSIPHIMGLHYQCTEVRQRRHGERLGTAQEDGRFRAAAGPSRRASTCSARRSTPRTP